MQTHFLDSSEVFDNFSEAFDPWNKKSKSIFCVLIIFYHKFHFPVSSNLLVILWCFPWKWLRHQEYNTFSKCFHYSSYTTQFPHLIFWSIRQKSLNKKKKQNFNRYNQPPGMWQHACKNIHTFEHFSTKANSTDTLKCHTPL